MAKIFKVNDKKAYKIEAIEMNGENFISLRQLYKTVKEPDEWKIGYKGIAIEARGAAKLAKFIAALATDPDTEYAHIETKKEEPKETKKPAKPKRKAK